MPVNHIFYKNNLISQLETQAQIIREQLLTELISAGSDPVVWKRRFRMLQHLSILESQLIDKIYKFETDDPKDYLDLKNLNLDLHITTSRNA